MKSTLKQDYFILTSPQDELKEISLVDSVEKISYESPRLSKRSTEKFAIDSWDISQKLKPFEDQNQRYKATLSSNFSPRINKSRFRAKSAFLNKEFNNTSDHNFNSRKKNTIQVSSQRKRSLLFTKQFRTIDEKKASISLAKQSSRKQKLLKSKNNLQRTFKLQQQTKMKTIQSYLIHQKEIINREKQLLMSQRVGKEGIQFCIYPTQYWEGIKLGSPVRKSKKNSLKITPVKRQTVQTKMSFATITPQRNPSFSSRIQDRQKSISTQSQSPIKRFQLFKDKIHQVTIH